MKKDAYINLKPLLRMNTRSLDARHKHTLPFDFLFCISKSKATFSSATHAIPFWLTELWFCQYSQELNLYKTPVWTFYSYKSDIDTL